MGEWESAAASAHAVVCLLDSAYLRSEQPCAQFHAAYDASKHLVLQCESPESLLSTSTTTFNGVVKAAVRMQQRMVQGPDMGVLVEQIVTFVQHGMVLQPHGDYRGGTGGQYGRHGSAGQAVQLYSRRVERTPLLKRTPRSPCSPGAGLTARPIWHASWEASYPPLGVSYDASSMASSHAASPHGMGSVQAGLGAAGSRPHVRSSGASHQRAGPSMQGRAPSTAPAVGGTFAPIEPGRAYAAY